jgi:hypothetical protein
MRYEMKRLVTMYEDEEYIYSLCICKNTYLIKDIKIREEDENEATFESVRLYNNMRIKSNDVYEENGKLYVKNIKTQLGIKDKNRMMGKLMEGDIRKIKSLTKYLQYII